MIRRLVVLLVVVAVAGAIAFGIIRERRDDDPFADYCAEVTERRDDIGAALSAGPQAGLLRALPSFEALAAEAPEDIRDDWRLVVDRIADLRDALDDAGIDPLTYDREKPPADVPEERRGAVDTAAVRLGSLETRTALKHVEQQARDVCKTPLSL